MSFFTAGNLLTLGIVILVLILYRRLDKHSDSLGKLRRYGDKLKEELGAFVAQREAAVKDYTVELDVQQKAARELLKRIVMTDDELAGKADAVTKIDERISAYDQSLEELMRMTSRVQENLARIRDESSFVENAAKRVIGAKEKVEDIERTLGEFEKRVEAENAAALEQTALEIMAEVKSSVSDLASEAETIERKVEGHREAVDKIEKQRAASLARDMDIINKTLKEAVEKAGTRADKMEEAALVKLRDQAQERVKRLQTAVEEKFGQLQDQAKSRVADVQGMVKSYKEEWKTEQADLESRQKSFREAWKKDMQELHDLARTQKESWKKELAQAEQKTLETLEGRFGEYQSLQAEQFRHLEAVSEDIGRLDGELRRAMLEVQDRVLSDFSRFEQDSHAGQERVSASFSASVERLRSAMSGLEEEITSLKTRAYDNVSEKLKVFEDDFFEDLSRRSGALDIRLNEWQNDVDTRLSALGEEAREERRTLEISFNEELKERLASGNDRFTAELAELKSETGAFEEGIREIMKITDESLVSLKDQFRQDLEDTRGSAEAAVKTELGRYELSLAEKLKQGQRELDLSIKNISDEVEEKSAEISDRMDASLKEIESWQLKFSTQIRDADAAVEEARRRARDLVNESDDRLASVRTAIQELRDEADSSRNDILSRTEEHARLLDGAIKEADRHIRDFTSQTKLFDKADALRLDLERRIEDLTDNLNRVEQRRAEAQELENQMIKIKRLEDDVNAKMTRFLSEKHRIESMEESFKRLLQTSEAVEEKLVQVSSSDDILQSMQVQLRRLEDALSASENKYQRVESKSQVLDMTNDGIDRNFKHLTETEKTLEALSGEIKDVSRELENMRGVTEKLKQSQEKVESAAERITFLDMTLKEIEGRIKDMQVAREWLARAETRMDEIYKETQSQLELTGSVLKSGSKPAKNAKGAPPLGVRENVLKLVHQGWTVKEIARACKISEGEVELIQEMMSKE